MWIFGPDCSGIKTPPYAGELVKGVSIPLRSIIYHNLIETGHLALYFPNLSLNERLWIAYCSDGKFDRTRKITLRKGGDNEFQISMPEVQLAAFKLEFSRGLPYISQFGEVAEKLMKTRAPRLTRRIYAREFDRIGVQPSIRSRRLRYATRPSRSEGKPKASKKHRTPTRNHDIKPIACSLCDSEITNQHYHKCRECGSIFDDSCTMRIEKELGQKDHDMTGWVRHCDWKRSQQRQRNLNRTLSPARLPTRLSSKKRDINHLD
jgi:hypothetical protein